MAGSRAAADELNPALGRAVAERGRHKVLGPLEVQARLSQAPGVQLALRNAREAVLQAEQHELQMNRTAAAQAAQDAIATLQTIRATYHEPRLVARAQVALALALLLEPADRQAAQRAFRLAFAADPNYQPNLDRIPPKNAQLLQEAIQQGEHDPPAPTRNELKQLAAKTALNGLIWIGISRSDDARSTVKVLVHDHSAATPKMLRRQVPSEQLLAHTADLVVQALGPYAVAAPATRASMGASDPLPPGKATPAPSPWYKRWWVWSLASAVMVGAGVSLALVLTGDEGDATPNPPPPQGAFDFHFHF